MKGYCAVCGELTTVRSDGKVRSHGYVKAGGGAKEPCPGSAQEPRENYPEGPVYSTTCGVGDCVEETVVIVHDLVNDCWESMCSQHGALQLVANKTRVKVRR